MKRIFLLAICACQLFVATAQKNAPKWLEKQRKAIVSISTYGADNQLLHTGTGVFVNESGDLIASYGLFKGANRAIVTDTEGKTYPVTTILGADDMYDVVKCKAQVPKKVSFLPIASEPIAEGAAVYKVPYVAGKTGTFETGPITEVSKLKDPYSYYKISIPAETPLIDAPLLTEKGEVFGLTQEDAGGSKEHIYAVSAGYINSLEVGSMDLLSNTYTAIHIKKKWPADVEQAQISLYLMGSTQSPQVYTETLNDFIATFPKSAEAYQSRAIHYAYKRALLASSPAEETDYLKKAMEDIETFGRLNEDKSEAIYQKAKLIFGIATSSELTDPQWSLETAMEVLQQAIKEKDLPLYHQMEGDIYFIQEDYENALNSYMIVNNSDMASSSSYYWAAKAKENIKGANIFEVITLLNKAIDKSIENASDETLSFIFERIDYKMQIMQYEEAVADYNLIYELLNGQVDDQFYYLREQVKSKQGDTEGALADIQEALKRNPRNSIYLAEEAAVYLKTANYQEALNSIQKAIELTPDFASCYRIKGLCFARQGQKAEACEAFHKAKELGDPVVDRLIKEHCN